jgi:site-specific DNA-cytosine methylase
MTAYDGNTRNPLGNNAEIGVGFSDTALLAASLTGFLILAATVYSIMSMRLKSSKEVEKEDLAGENDYEMQLLNADVSTLNRSQRRARARVIMRRKRQALIDEDLSDVEPEIGSDAEGSDDGEAAKATEEDERRVQEEERREQQKQAQEDAQKQKREEEREDDRKQEASRLLEKKERAEKEELERAESEAWESFLSSPNRSQSVQEWIDEMKDRRTVLTTEIATSFELPEEKVVQRIQELIQEGRVAGVMEGNGRFIFIAEDELHSIAESLIERGVLSLSDVAAVCNENLVASEATREK